MRCLSSDDVPVALSRLALHPPPSSHPFSPGHGDVTASGKVCDVTIPAGPIRAFPLQGVVWDSSSSSQSSSPRLSPMSPRSHSDDFTHNDDLVHADDFADLKDFRMPSSSHFAPPHMFPASVSSPELNSFLQDSARTTLTTPGPTHPPPPSVSSSSLRVSNSSSRGVNHEGGSCTSTARNSPGRTSSLSGSSPTIAEDVHPHPHRTISSAVDLSASETQLVGRTTSRAVRVPAPRTRKLSEGRADGIVSDLLKRYHYRSADAVVNTKAVKNGEGKGEGEGEGEGEAEKSDHPTSVQLPERYCQALRKSGSAGNIGGVSVDSRKTSGSSNSNNSSSNASNSSSNASNSSSGDQGHDLSSREKDLGTALAWIRNEMVQMKEQDKLLLKRFIELRATILQLRCTYGSASDLCSMDGSCASLNYEPRSSGGSTRTALRNAGSDAMLAGRMYAAPSSLSLPCSPQLSRFRWAYDDF